MIIFRILGFKAPYSFSLLSSSGFTLFYKRESSSCFHYARINASEGQSLRFQVSSFNVHYFSPYEVSDHAQGSQGKSLPPPPPPSPE